MRVDTMSDLIWLSIAQIFRIEPYSPLSYGLHRWMTAKLYLISYNMIML
jgi:hypothetical protein